MQTRNRNTFTTIHTEGALLPVDLLQRISGNDKNLEGLLPESYHLAPGEKLTETINRSWNRLYGLWGAFQAARSNLGSNDAGTTITRERWLLPLFQELGFGRLSTTRAVEIEGKSYPISHAWQNIPLHLVGCGLDLDKRTPGAAGAARTSPHSLLQEYLNQSEEAQWGVISNGLRLRILRDNATLTRQAYIEFDLEAMFEGEVYSDFTLVWLICHQSRFESNGQQAECMLERWSKSAQQSGTRALDALRRGVEEAIVNLGQGFLQHPLNSKLRSKLKQGDLSAQDYYRQLLRLVYRLIFLFVAEDRDLLLLPDASVEARQRYQQYYSTAHLRSLAEKQRGSRHHDRYEALQLVMTLLGSDTGCSELALPALGGFLFGATSTSDLNEAKLDNRSLLAAVRSLAFITEGNIRRGVDYRNLGPEELGSVYESLLELHPLLNTDAATFELTSAAGNERKTTGSYYTPSSLIHVLLDSALDPVIQDRLKGKQNFTQQEQSLLDLKVCDPACGSGHFLIAAAHRIAGKLAEVRAGGDEPSPNETRRALRDVIRHCIYGVDINPMAVELCKVNLWLESLEPGKPLSFLDAHIKCGNSLVGMGPKMRIDDLEVPDEAFNPVTGDHKSTAALLKKRNKAERPGQESLFVTVLKTKEDLDRWLAEHERMLEAMPEDNAAEVQAKVEAYQIVNESAQYRKQRQIADLWAAAFFWTIEQPKGTTYEIIAPTQTQLRRLRAGQNVQIGLLAKVAELSLENKFFHWPLEFAEVAAQGGFDCVLGNPPWERMKLEEKEFFATYDPLIVAAQNKNNRQKLVEQLYIINPELANLFTLAKHSAECESKFVRKSNRYPFTSAGDINTYALFAEHNRNSINNLGFTGFLAPTSLITVDSAKYFFGDLLEKNQITSIIDFDNTQNIFPEIDSNFKFCIITLNGKRVGGVSDPLISCIFAISNTNQLNDHIRQISLGKNDFALFNPNTHTSPIIRSKIDAEILKNIYMRVPILIEESTDSNEWGVVFQLMFMMNTDSYLFKDSNYFLEGGYQLNGNVYSRNDETWLPLYEGKMMQQFDHRFAHVGSPNKGQHIRGTSINISLEEHEKPDILAFPRYWVEESETEKRYKIKRNWIIGFRDVAGTVTNIRTLVFTLLPKIALGNKVPVVYLYNANQLSMILSFIGNSNSLVLDYIARQKTSGMSLNFYIIKQLPYIPQKMYSVKDTVCITPRILELIFTSWDIQQFADDLWLDSSPEMRDAIQHHWEENAYATGGGHSVARRPVWCKTTSDGFPYPPFRWNDDRRAILRAELDAYYARLYGLNRKQLRYILDPADLTERELEDILDPWEEVTDPLDSLGYAQRAAVSDFPGETFRVLKEKEIKQFGEYRTRRLVLEAWNRLEGVDVCNPNAYPAQGAAVPSKQETVSVTQSRSESRPAEVQTPLPEPAKPPLPVTPPAKVEKEIDPPEAQPTLTDFGLYKCDNCGKLVLGFDMANHEQEKHGGKSVEWKKLK